MSSGAQMDITQATRLARSMVCEWGMSELGTIAFDERSEGGAYLGMANVSSKTYSDETAKKIDLEVSKLINEGHKRALDIVQAESAKVELMTEMLIEFETLDRKDVEEMMNGTWNIESKRARLKVEEELSRKSPSAAPIRDVPVPSSETPPQPLGA
jgi:cell division protease FtsH